MTMTPQYTVASLDALRNIPLAGASTGVAAGAGTAAGASPGAPGAAQSQILGSLGTLDRGSQEAVISHYNVQPVIDIFGSVQGRDLGGAAREVPRLGHHDGRRFTAGPLAAGCGAVAHTRPPLPPPLSPGRA